MTDQKKKRQTVEPGTIPEGNLMPWEREDAGGVDEREAAEGLLELEGVVDPDDVSDDAGESRSDADEDDPRYEEDDFDDVFDEWVDEDDESDETDEEDEVDEDYDDEADEYEEEGEEEPTDDELFTVKVDGEERQVTLDELTDNYQLAESSHQRFQEAAEARKEAQAEKEALSEARQMYLQRLDAATRMLESQTEDAFADVDWDRLRVEDPGEFAAKKAEYLEAQQQKEQLQRERAKVQQEEYQAWREEVEKTVQAETEKLLEEVPEWKDEEKMVEGMQDLVQYATTTYGWAPEQLGQITDHRVVLALRKAMKYDQLQEEGEDVRQKVRKGKKLKPGGRKRKGTRSRKGKKKQKRAEEQVARTGRTEDAAAAIRGLL